uniref:PRA1 family protein n=1 Tax=Podarcis muralis TaxID=64176 RepID=A0A670JVB0_PODMU
MSEVRLPPVRALEDFLLGSSRLSPPDVRDLQRWHNRVVNNLLYYQSNYLLVLGAGLLLGGYFRPLLTLLSAALVTLIFVGFIWAAENKAPCATLPAELPRHLPPFHPRLGVLSGVSSRRLCRLLVFHRSAHNVDPHPCLPASSKPQKQD